MLGGCVVQLLNLYGKFGNINYIWNMRTLVKVWIPV